MPLFGRTSGYYIFWTGFIYFCVGMYLAFTHTAQTEYATLGFVLALSVPLWCPPVARYFNMEPMMFNFFKKPDYDNVIKFPEVKAPYIVPDSPEQVKEAIDNTNAHYTIGVNEHSRTQLRIQLEHGSATLTMTEQGVVDLIEDLAHSIRKEFRVEVTPLLIVATAEDYADDSYH